MVGGSYHWPLLAVVGGNAQNRAFGVGAGPTQYPLVPNSAQLLSHDSNGPNKGLFTAPAWEPP